MLMKGILDGEIMSVIGRLFFCLCLMVSAIGPAICQDAVTTVLVPHVASVEYTSEKLEAVKKEFNEKLDGKVDLSDRRFDTISLKRPQGELPEGHAFIWID
ncbi:MAG: hypothetical protein J6R22_04930 [Alphaproteobacteria bacterium]|nr:hypothetical protein [Alphaproteobacteria bacterium]